jgi:hypothetical protein
MTDADDAHLASSAVDHLNVDHLNTALLCIAHHPGGPVSVSQKPQVRTIATLRDNV